MRVLRVVLVTVLTIGAVSMPRAETELAKGMLLVATRDLLDPLFFHAVVLLVHHDERGAMGLVINRSTDIEAAHVLPEIDAMAHYEGKIYAGGPVAIHAILVLVRTHDSPELAEKVVDDIYITASPEILTEMASADLQESHLRIYAGHAGWAPGQLEHEIARGSWHIVPATPELVFSADPTEIWQQLVPPEQPLLTAVPAVEM